MRCPVLGLSGDSAGVLPNQYLAEAVAQAMITSSDSDIPPGSIQPASLDLRLGAVAHRLRCSFLPSGQTVERRMQDVALDQFSLAGEGAVLAPGFPYLIPLKERLNLPDEIHARANPKSSTGRADVFTRVITDYSYRFDDIAPGYEGRLYLEVAPLSFPILVREDLTLNQLRLSVGHTELRDEDIRDLHRVQPILFVNGEEVSADTLHLSSGVFLSLDLRGDAKGRVGHRARQSPPLLDLTRVHGAEPKDYWETVHREDGRRIVLTPERFYLLMSYEAVSIPPMFAAEMTAYDTTSGELRTHYAGFFDPGFGYDEGDRFKGSTAALEVRAHDVPFMIEHRQPVCKLTFERMIAEPTQLYGKGIGSNYQQQAETLGKHFNVPSRRAGKAAGRRNGPEPMKDQLDLLAPE